MTSDGEKLKIKNGKSMKVSFRKFAKEEMSLFYGQRESTGNMNWKPAKEKLAEKREVYVKKTGKASWSDLKLKPDSNNKLNIYNDSLFYTERVKEIMTAEDTLMAKVYEATEIRSFGWINCDRFYNNPISTLAITFNPKDSVSSANIFFVFLDIKSLLHHYYIRGQAGNYNGILKPIPVGTKMKLIVYTIKNDKVLAYSSDITTKAEEEIVPTLKEIKEKDFKKLMTGSF
jgi:hypothetical protein